METHTHTHTVLVQHKAVNLLPIAQFMYCRHALTVKVELNETNYKQ